MSDDDHKQTARCWHQMFRNPTVAYGYPIPVRNHDGEVSFVGYYTTETFAYYTQQFCRVSKYLSVSWRVLVLLPGYVNRPVERLPEPGRRGRRGLQRNGIVEEGGVLAELLRSCRSF